MRVAHSLSPVDHGHEISAGATQAEGPTSLAPPDAVEAQATPGLRRSTLTQLALETGISEPRLRAAISELCRASADQLAVTNASLADAVIRGHAADVALYLARGGDPNQRVDIPQHFLATNGPCKSVPLVTIAAALGHAEVLERIAPHVDLDFSYDCKDLGFVKNGPLKAGDGVLNANPLVAACFYQHAACIEVLAKRAVRLDRTLSTTNQLDPFALVATSMPAWSALLGHPAARPALAGLSADERKEIALRHVRWATAASVADSGLMTDLALSPAETLTCAEYATGGDKHEPALMRAIFAAFNRSDAVDAEGEVSESALFIDALLAHDDLRRDFLTYEFRTEREAPFAKLMFQSMKRWIERRPDAETQVAQFVELALSNERFLGTTGPLAIFAAINGRTAILAGLEKHASKPASEWLYTVEDTVQYLLPRRSEAAATAVLDLYVRHGIVSAKQAKRILADRAAAR